MNLRRTAHPALLASVVLLAACGGDSGSSPSPTPTPTSVPSPPPTSKVVLGYYLGAASDVSLTRYFGYLNVLSADVFNVRSDGGISGSAPSDLVSFDNDRGIRTYACVANIGTSGAFDSALAHAAIVTNRTATVQSMVALARSGGYTGVNVDIENLYLGDRAAFSAFIIELGAALRTHGLKLAISVPAKLEENPREQWTYPFDYAVLGAHADLIQLMTYDQHGSWSAPGPIAGRDWVEKCVVFAKGSIPPAKLLIGLPAYGYDWNLDTSRFNDFPWTSVPALLATTGATLQYQASSDSPFITYKDTNGYRHEAWFENTQSIVAKVALVRKHGLAGVAMWRMGHEDLDFWVAARTGLD